jgi:26S proteasome regulatory subunit T5
MASAPPPGELPSNNDQKADTSGPTSSDGPVAMDVTSDAPREETWDDIPEDIMALSTEEIMTRTRLIDNDIKEWF